MRWSAPIRWTSASTSHERPESGSTDALSASVVAEPTSGVCGRHRNPLKGHWSYAGRDFGYSPAPDPMRASQSLSEAPSATPRR